MMILYSMLLCSLLALASSQYHKSSKDAAILSEARYLSVNGQFGSAYKQEDGVEFKEESDDEGNRKGSYSYLDPNGVRRTVSYTAGKEGFRATGDHLPAAPVPVLPAPRVAEPPPPTGQYKSNDDYDDSLSKSYENEYNYQYTPPKSVPQHVQPELAGYNGQLNSIPHQHAASFNPVQFQYQSVEEATNFNHHKSEPSSRRVPSYPGKLSVNRSPNGYSYTFNTV